MQPSDLAFCTTKELVDELMQRKTFLGVVIHAEQELKQPNWTGEKIFQLHVNPNLKTEEAGRLLGVVASHLDRQEC